MRKKIEKEILILILEREISNYIFKGDKNDRMEARREASKYEKMGGQIYEAVKVVQEDRLVQMY